MNGVQVRVPVCSSTNATWSARRQRCWTPTGSPTSQCGGWRDRVAAICRQLRDALLSHTDGAELVSASFAAGQSEVMARILAWLTDAAADAGVYPTHAELAARTVVYYVLGFTADEQSRLQWDAAGADLPDEQSVLSEDPSARFAFGLRLLVDGIAAHTPAQTNVSATKFE